MATKAVKKEKVLTFAWEGTDKKGNKVKGESNATNISMVRAELRKQGVIPSKVKQKAKPLFSSKKKITTGDIAIFSRQLATMMKAGVPLVQSFDIVGRGHENPSMQEMLLAIKADIEGGTALAPALSKYPLYFDDLFCNLVDAGEKAGALETLLEKIATYKEKTESIKKKIKKALTYPIAVIFVAVIVTAIIMIFVIPQFDAMFANFGSDLPAFTQMVVAMSEFVQEYWWVVGGIIFGAISTFIAVYKRSKKLRESTDIFLLKVPAFGDIIRKAAVARFSRTLATMFAAGVPLVEALNNVAGATGNIVYEKAVLRIKDDVSTGQSLNLAMKQVDLFPSMVLQMVAIGEESGSIDSMLDKVADFYEEEVDNAVDSISSLIEPMIMAILGVLIGGLVIAMYLPIFKMGSVIGG